MIKNQIVDLLQKINDVSDITFIDCDIEEYVEKILLKSTIIASIRNNKLDAIISYYTNDESRELAYITVLAVDPSCQGMGVGKRLMDSAIEDCRLQGFKYCKLEVIKENLKAIKLHEKLGFRISEEREKSYYMIKRLR